MWQVEVSHKSEMAGLFNRGDTIINKHFTLLYFCIVYYIWYQLFWRSDNWKWYLYSPCPPPRPQKRYWEISTHLHCVYDISYSWLQIIESVIFILRFHLLDPNQESWEISTHLHCVYNISYSWLQIIESVIFFPRFHLLDPNQGIEKYQHICIVYTISVILDFR